MKCTGRNCPMQIGTVDPAHCLADECPYVTKPLTNADRIRAMSDEELAQFFPRTASEFSCHPGATNEDCKKVGGWWHGCPQCWLDWLKQEVDDG